MSELPSREMAERARVDDYAGLVVWKLIRAYVADELMTAAEWHDTIDYEAGGQEYHRVINTKGGHHTDRTKARFIIDKALP